MLTLPQTNRSVYVIELVVAVAAFIFFIWFVVAGLVQGGSTGFNVSMLVFTAPIILGLGFYRLLIAKLIKRQDGFVRKLLLLDAIIAITVALLASPHWYGIFATLITGYCLFAFKSLVTNASASINKTTSKLPPNSFA